MYANFLEEYQLLTINADPYLGTNDCVRGKLVSLWLTDTRLEWDGDEAVGSRVFLFV